MAALNTLNAKDLGECKGMIKPPSGVDHVFASTMVLLAGSYAPIVNKGGKVKDRSWDATKKQALGDIKGYMAGLVNLKDMIDNSAMPEINMKEIRPYLNVDTEE